MPTFVWEGRTRTGEQRKGTLEAKNDADLVATLRQQNISVTKVRRKSREINISFGTGVGHRDIVVFTRQFATMIDAGLPLVQALDILATQADNKRFGKIINDVKLRVEGGSSFSDALRGHPKVFDELFVNLVAAGEVAGILDTIMLRLATYIEKLMKLRSKVKSAMIYPIAVAIVAVAVIIIMLWKVIPVFESMFRDMGAGALPSLTQFVLDVSRGFVNHVGLIMGGLVGLVIGTVFFHRTRRGKKFFHTLFLKMPILGPVLRKSAVARFTRTFGTLLSSGVPILDAMDIVARTAGNVVIEEAVLKVRKQVAEGRDVATPLMQTRVFPPMVVQMIGVGEQTGAMDQMLQKIADFYEDEVDNAVSGLTSLMEPLMIVVLGGIIGVIMISMYMPIFQLAGNIRGA
jgi:type IV pilus assembly protein PilC